MPPTRAAPDAATTGNPAAVASVVFGGLGLVLGIATIGIIGMPFGLAAIASAFVGLQKARDPAIGREGMAIAGLVLGLATIAVSLLLLALVGDLLEQLGKGN
jgi:hypothetical protein